MVVCKGCSHVLIVDVKRRKRTCAFCEMTDMTPLSQEEVDAAAVQNFALMMQVKMLRSSQAGKAGWDDPQRCTPAALRAMLLRHLAKGDPVDVANFCMMLWARGESVSSTESLQQLAEWFYAQDERGDETLEDLQDRDPELTRQRELADKIADQRDLLRRCLHELKKTNVPVELVADVEAAVAVKSCI